MVSIKIYDITDNEIETLVHGEKQQGNYQINFNASSYGSGVYFYKLQTEKNNECKKMVIIK